MTQGEMQHQYRVTAMKVNIFSDLQKLLTPKGVIVNLVSSPEIYTQNGLYRAGPRRGSSRDRLGNRRQIAAKA